MRSDEPVARGRGSRGASALETHPHASEDAPVVLGEILKRARSHRKLTLRQVEQKTGIPNAHLSQIERGVIRRPDAVILLKLAELYVLDYALLAKWTGYLDARTSGDSGALINAAMRVFADLRPEQQIEALEFIEALRHNRSARKHH